MAPPTLDMGHLPRMASWWLLGVTHGAELQAVTLTHAPQGLHPCLNAWTLRCGQPGVLEQDTVWSAPVTQPSPGSAAGRCLRPFGRSAGWEGGGYVAEWAWTDRSCPSLGKAVIGAQGLPAPADQLSTPGSHVTPT